MSKQKERKEIVTQFAKCAYTGKIPNKLKNRLNQLLIEETNGKLYKYRQCTKYPLKNLEEGTMYCEHPIKFNDPFDCKFGMTIQSFYEDKIDTEIDAMVDLFEYLKTLHVNSSYIKQLKKEDKKVFNNLMQDPMVLLYFRKYAKKIKKNDVLRSIFRTNPYVAIYIMELMLKNKTYAKNMSMLKCLMPEIRSKIFGNTNYRNVKIDEEFTIKDVAIKNGIDEDVDEIELYKMLVKSIDHQSVYTVNELERMMIKTVESVNKKNNDTFLIGCLAGSNKNRLMWSHYANNHKGFCVEYDFSDIGSDNIPPILPIVYAKNRPIYPWKPQMRYTKNAFREALEQIVVGLLTKDEAWSYENEWRVMIKIQEKQNIKMPPITCVYLGAAMTTKNKNRIIKIAKANGLKVKQMVLDRGTYELHAKDVLY